jgi:hypothetical protein
MIVLTLFILLFGFCGLLTGASIVTRLVPAPCFDKATDRAFLATWLGVLILADTFLAVTLYSPLTPAIVIAITLSLVGLSLLTQHSRAFISDIFGKLTAGNLFGAIALTLGVAAYCSQVIVWYDTRLYHMQAIKWLSEYGLVPGQALIHERFGYVSSWFAPAAAVNHGPLQGRIGSFTGGFCLLLLVGHFLTALLRIIRKDGRARDVFLVAAALPALVIIMVYGIPNSPSPDLPIIVLVIEFAWCILAIAEFRRDNPGQFDTALNAALIPLLLGAGAVSVKLSALPLMAVAGCFYLLNGKLVAGKLAVGGVVLIFFFAPLAAAGLVTTGCAFYPAPTFCSDLPWSLGAGQAAAESNLIRDWARWGGGGPPAYARDWNWIIPWFTKETGCALLLLLSVIAAAVMILQCTSLKRMPGNLYVIALAGAGIAFLLYAVPTWRFGLGYLVLIPALLASTHTERLMHLSGKIRRFRLLFSAPGLAIIGAFALAFHIYLLPRPTFRPLEQFASANPAIVGNDRPHFNLLIPPRLWSVDFETDPETGRKIAASPAALIKDSSADVVYYRPDPAKSELCGDAPLPCSPLGLHDVSLRNFGKGISGGFVRDGYHAGTK